MYSHLHNHLEKFPNHPIAVKLSATGLIFEKINELYKISKNDIYIDTEELGTNKVYNKFIEECWYNGIFIGKTYQMYKKEEIKELEHDIFMWGIKYRTK